MKESISDDAGPQLLEFLMGMPASTYPLIGATLFLLMLSAIISGSEVAFFSLSPGQITMCLQSTKINEKRISELLGKPKELLASILIANNLVNVGIVTLSTFATWQIAGKDSPLAIFVLIVLVTALIVFFGEIMPKVYAQQHNLMFARFTSGGLALAMKVFSPLANILILAGDFIEKRMESKGYEVSMEELQNAVEMTTDGVSTEEEKEILKGIVNFGRKNAKQIMRSRIDITAFESDIDFHELMDKINKCGYSRIPIYTETIDSIEGILYIKDVLPHIDQDEFFSWQELIRKDTFFVPESKMIDDLLRDFQEKRVHIAVVVDEYGGTSGIITMEDIIEEIVGEINDEFDEDELIYKKIDDTTYTFEGKTSLNDFCKVLDLEQTIFDEVKGDSESLGGLLLELFSKFPKAGEKIAYSNFVFTAVSVNPKRIKNVRVHIQ